MDDRAPGGRKYIAIRAELLSRITGGTWAPGALIPKREDLAKTLGTTKATLEKAISELIAQGYLNATRKKGTFVSEGPRLTRVALVAPPSAGNNLDQPRGDSIFLSAAEGFFRGGANLSPRLLPYPAFEAEAHLWDVAVLLYPEPAEIETALRFKAQNGLRPVALNRTPESMDFISFDNYAAALGALRRYGRLCPPGFTPVFLTVQNAPLPVRYRLDGFREGLREGGGVLGGWPGVEVELPAWADAGSVLEKNDLKPPLAIVSGSGWAGPSVAAYIKKAGLELGRDIWYTGFDDEDPLRQHGLHFSTYRQDPVALGVLAAQKVTALISGQITSCAEKVPIAFIEGVG